MKAVMDEHSLTPLTASELAPGQSYLGILLRDQTLTVGKLTAISLEECLLDKLAAGSSDWTSARLTDVQLTRCEMANASWRGARANRAEFSRCRLTGWNVSEVQFRAVCCRGSKIDLAVWHDARLDDCRFESCDLREADFQAATLQNTTFRRCDLRGARFAATKMTDIDFRGSHLAGIQIDAECLAGAVVDPAQLADVAGALGLIVEPLPDEDSPSIGEP